MFSSSVVSFFGDPYNIVDKWRLWLEFGKELSGCEGSGTRHRRLPMFFRPLSQMLCISCHRPRLEKLREAHSRVYFRPPERNTHLVIHLHPLENAIANIAASSTSGATQWLLYSYALSCERLGTRIPRVAITRSPHRAIRSGHTTAMAITTALTMRQVADGPQPRAWHMMGRISCCDNVSYRSWYGI
jgi:hypothetical protein